MSTRICCGNYAGNMVFPQKFFVNMNSWVLGMVNFLQSFVLDFIIKSNNFPFIYYCENLEFVGVEFHWPSLLPLNKCIFASSLCRAVVSSFDLITWQICVNSKKANCWWNCKRQVANVHKNNSGPKTDPCGTSDVS